LPPVGWASLKDGDAAVARGIAEDSATLLRNEQGILPLRRDESVAVLGPTAVAPYYGGGGSAHVTPYDGSVSAYTAIKAQARTVTYTPGYDLDGQVVPSSAITAPDPAAGYPNWTLTPADAAFAGQPGLLRQQITTDPVASGAQPVLATGGAPDQLDSTVDSSVPAGTAWRWSGLLTAPANPGGTGWQLKVFVQNQAGAALFVDGLDTGSRRVNIGAYPAAPSSSYAGLSESARSHDPAEPALQQGTWSATLGAGQQVHLDLRVTAGAAPTRVQLRWVPPDNATRAINAAVAAARAARTVVLFAYDDGTEGSDRGSLALPGYQNELISAVAAANPNTVVVLNTGDAVLMPWAGAVAGILEMWYPGQEGGTATANVLYGRANPGGKLPVTFPATATQTPVYDPSCTDTSATGNCPMYPGVVGPSPFLAGATTSYRTSTALAVNGIYMGYRWFDKQGVAPLYPFGYGLSYTSFSYTKLRVTAERSGGVEVSFQVRNSGARVGAVVPQVYFGASPDLPVRQAVAKLIGFARVPLGPGQTRQVTREQLSSWSATAGHWLAGTGKRTVWVGSSSREPHLKSTATIR
jgi:beta-glucosidase